MPSKAAKEYLAGFLLDLERGARAIDPTASPGSALLFTLCATEFLSFFYSGSRRPAGTGGVRAFQAFLTRYFPRFNECARTPDGRYRRIRIPLLRSAGKASRRLKLPAALVHLFRRGLWTELLAPANAPQVCCLEVPDSRWGFQIHAGEFCKDFLDTLHAYGEDMEKDPIIARRFLRRFHHLHG